MKRFFLLAMAFSIVLTSCLKGNDPCTNKSPEEEAPAISAFCLANGINATVDPDGIYYEILDIGSGNTITNVFDTIVMKYEGKLLNGTQIDKDSVKTLAGGFIPGFQFGLTNVKGGGHIKVVMPSYQAYGCKGYRSIPANSPLYFDIELLEVRKYRQ